MQKWKLMGGFVSLLLALGCSGKLTVDRHEPRKDGAQGGEGGEGGAPSEPGLLGGPCLPEALQTEAKGSLAETDVRFPDRCNDGLICNPERTCAAAQTCADTSDQGCVIHAAAEPGAITALVGDDSHLYFTTYGTRDKLGNYQGDGALFAYSIAEGTTTAVASDLQGPKQLAFTSSHAYFAVDGGGQHAPQFFRVPLEGGTPELIEGSTPASTAGYGGLFFVSFTSVGDLAIWTDGTATHSMAADPGAKPKILFEPGGWTMASDGNDLFYADAAASSISRIPVTGGSSDALLFPARLFALKGDDLYGIETLLGIQQVGESPGAIRTVYTGTLLTRAAKSGGQWQRVRALGGGGTVSRFQVVGDRYFYDQEAPQAGSDFTDGYSTTVSVVTGSLTSEEPPLRLLERPQSGNWFEQVWVGTSNALFWTDGGKIYSKILDP